jgi:hypothetical protein
MKNVAEEEEDKTSVICVSGAVPRLRPPCALHHYAGLGLHAMMNLVHRAIIVE